MATKKSVAKQATTKKAIKKAAAKSAIKKIAPKKAAAKTTAVKRAGALNNGGTSRQPGPGEVRIRMYRQGLGDCFLLTFGDSGKHVLIDCGLLAGTPKGVDRIQAVAQHVSDSTSQQLEVLIVTHEHWDHVSGFTDARGIFEAMTINQTWVAWTEDPSQTIAIERRAAKAMRLSALTAAVHRMNESGDPEAQQRAASISQTMNFQGGLQPGAEVLGAFSPKTDDAMDWITDKKRNPIFLEPGKPVKADWLTGATVRVLGPPQDKKALNKMDGVVGTDMYGMALTREDLGFAAALGVGPDKGEADWMPFDRALQWTNESEWLQGFRTTPKAAAHEGKGGAEERNFVSDYRAATWRRVDTEWLNSASDLALQLDNAVNNTSLVLAFEFGDKGDVLLFVGDAQIGNWLSWAKDNQDLLQRTVFYKVGHHGSHNATLKVNGLESMTSPKLVAAIPVDETFAKGKKPIPWMMPADKLYKVLQERTKERILRVDKDFPQGSAKPAPLSATDWKAFTDSVAVDPLFIDYFCTPNS